MNVTRYKVLRNTTLTTVSKLLSLPNCYITVCPWLESYNPLFVNIHAKHFLLNKISCYEVLGWLSTYFASNLNKEGLKNRWPINACTQAYGFREKWATFFKIVLRSYW